MVTFIPPRLPCFEVLERTRQFGQGKRNGQLARLIVGNHQEVLSRTRVM